MKNRNKKLINKRYQLKTAAKLIIISSLSSLIIISILVMIALSSGQDLLTNTAEKLDSSVARQEQLINSMLAYSHIIKNQGYEFAVGKARKDHSDSISIIKENIDLLKDSAARNRILLLAVIILMVLQGIIMAIFVIRYTHRTSGPLYVMTQYIKDFRKGKKVQFRDLRKKDEGKELYDEIKGLITSLQQKKDKEREKKRKERIAAKNTEAGNKNRKS